jgi:glutamate/tyrosine decarboxylase-like PLP-dependent enzyme
MMQSNDENAWLSPCFLGSYAENNDLLEKLLLEFVRDHVYWRRNIHPEDTPPISALAQEGPEYREFVARTKSQLHELSARLKRSVPFFNPRYIGHMASDLLLPGVIAQLVATLYNPNNVVDEAAPVTLPLELEVGNQLAAMLGYNTDPARRPCAFGHLTSGGTMANNEALWYFRAVRFWPPAARKALAEAGVDPGPSRVLGSCLAETDDRDLFRLSIDDVVELRREFNGQLAGWTSAERNRIVRAIEAERIECLGEAEFQRRHPKLAGARVVVPVTAHYSWEKAVKLLGLGSAQLVHVAVDEHMRMDGKALQAELERLHGDNIPVLAVIGILGTTEFGTIDPVHEIIAARQRMRKRGMEFAVHLDAAWGGYLACLFHGPDGALINRDRLRRGFRYFPSAPVYKAFAAIRHADSVTVDPHKLGYLPFGCGAYVARNRAQTDFIDTRAAYVFEPEETRPQVDYARRFRNLGQFILEGSKPGAVAAAAWVTHNVLPLDHDHFGRLPAGTIRSCEYFFDVIEESQRRLGGIARLIVPFEPDTNLVCLAINPEGNRSLARMNAFGRRLYLHLNVETGMGDARREFFGSRTLVRRSGLSDAVAGSVMERLGLDPASFTEAVEDPEVQADSAFLLRHTLMNPWLTDVDRGQNYLDRYLRYLEFLIRQELAIAGP